MKHIIVLLMAAVVAVGASAGVNIKPSHEVNSNRLSTVKKPARALKQLRGGPSRVITEQPAGEVKSYLRAGNAIYPYAEQGVVNIYSGEQVDGRMDIVYAEDGKVYLKNILYNIGSAWINSWVEGQLSEDGTEIVVPLGQSVYHSYTYSADIVLAWGSTSVTYDQAGNAMLDFEVDSRMTEVVYTIDGETIYGPVGIAPVEDPDNEFWGFVATGLGTYWTDDNSFAGALEWGTVFTETEPLEPTGPSIITEQPEGDLITLHRNTAYILHSDNIYNGKTDGEVNVVINAAEGKAYIQNPLWWHDYGYWVEGTYDSETGLITVPTGQYVFYNESANYGIQLMWGSTYAYQDFDGNYRLSYTIDTDVEEIYFYLEGTNLYLLDAAGNIDAEFPEWGNATGLMGMYSDHQTMTSIEFPNVDDEGNQLPFAEYLNIVPAVPANPVIDDWWDDGDEDGNTFLFFNLPTTDIDGHPIAPELLSFSIFVENGNGPEVFTFDADTYEYDLPWDMTEIPYDIYSMGYDITAYGCVFYRTNYGDNPLFTEDIGIQVYYTVDGVRNESDIVWFFNTGHGTSVSEVNAGKTVASVRYYNAAGQQMARPDGLTIVVTTYTDGTTSAVKVVK